MSYVEQGIGKRFGSLSTFLLQLDPTCFLENKQKTSSSTSIKQEPIENLHLNLGRQYNVFRTAYHPCKYLSNPTNRNMRKKKDDFYLLKSKFNFFSYE